MPISATLEVDLGKAYNYAKSYISRLGFENEIKWQNDLRFDEIEESDFLREGAWVILCSGMKESIIRKYFDEISICFFEWESAEKIVEAKNFCYEYALNIFNNPRKISAIIDMAARVLDIGFEELKKSLHHSPLEMLQTFQFIGPVSSYHLAKNIGLPIAKPDRHLVRLSTSLGYDDVNTFCSTISRKTGDAVAVVDIVLWRFATLRRDYLEEFSNYEKE